jgi:hypothetical protein
MTVEIEDKKRKIREAELEIDKRVAMASKNRYMRGQLEEEVDEIIKKLAKEGYLTKEELNYLAWRRDKRSNLTFFMDIKRHCKKTEDQEQADIVKGAYKKANRIIDFRDFGNVDMGAARLVNDESKPDKLVMIDGKEYVMDLKKLKEHCFKVSDLKNYSKDNSGIFVIEELFVYAYRPITVKKLYKMALLYKDKVFMHEEWGKMAIKVGEDEQSIISLQYLIDKTYVRKLPR